MSRWHSAWYRLALLLRRRAEEAEMAEEMRFHLEMGTEANLRAGMGPEEARRRALLAFGGVTRHAEAVRAAGRPGRGAADRVALTP